MDVLRKSGHAKCTCEGDFFCLKGLCLLTIVSTLTVIVLYLQAEVFGEESTSWLLSGKLMFLTHFWQAY